MRSGRDRTRRRRALRSITFSLALSSLAWVSQASVMIGPPLVVEIAQDRDGARAALRR
jgi:hypothetical protein